MSGESGQYTTGFWVHRDFEEPSVPGEFLDVIGINLDGPIEGFPDDWGEALELLGISDEDEDEEDDDDEDDEDDDEEDSCSSAPSLLDA